MNTTNRVPRMRTVPEAVKMLQELDGSTAVTLRAVRRMVNNGEIPVLQVGNKRLVDFDKLLECLSGSALTGTASDRAAIHPVSLNTKGGDPFAAH